MLTRRLPCSGESTIWFFPEGAQTIWSDEHKPHSSDGAWKTVLHQSADIANQHRYGRVYFVSVWKGIDQGNFWGMRFVVRRGHPKFKKKLPWRDLPWKRGEKKNGAFLKERDQNFHDSNMGWTTRFHILNNLHTWLRRSDLKGSKRLEIQLLTKKTKKSSKEKTYDLLKNENWPEWVAPESF